jgi:hypothetical protein
LAVEEKAVEQYCLLHLDGLQLKDDWNYRRAFEPLQKAVFNMTKVCIKNTSWANVASYTARPLLAMRTARFSCESLQDLKEFDSVLGKPGCDRVNHELTLSRLGLHKTAHCTWARDLFAFRERLSGGPDDDWWTKTKLTLWL